MSTLARGAPKREWKRPDYIMKDFEKYFSGLKRDFGFCNVKNGYYDPKTNKLKFDPGDYVMLGLKTLLQIKIMKII